MNEVTVTDVFHLEDWGLMEEIPALDLRREAARAKEAGEPWQYFNVAYSDHPEQARVLILPAAGRAGVAWGADAQWTDLKAGEDAEALALALRDEAQAGRWE